MYFPTLVSPTSMPSLSSSAVDAWCAREWVLATQSADQFANLFWHLRTAALSVPDLPGPEPSEASPVPCDHGLRLDNHEGASPVAPHFRQPGPEDSIGVGQLWPLRRATQNADLMAESDDLKLEGDTAAERPPIMTRRWLIIRSRARIEAVRTSPTLST